MELLNKIWWTRKSKIQAEKRLLANASQTQILLLWYSFVSVAASIHYLKFNAQSEYAGISWVLFSILILCISGFINGLGYKERATLVKDSYEALQKLYDQEKYNPNPSNLSDLANKYEKILSICENHSDIDYHLALCYVYLASHNPHSDSDRTPTYYSWVLFVWHHFKRVLLLIILYLLPFLVYLIQEFGNVCKGTV
ncbi:SLATT domain-containing protein [bacterium endosymbiont of Bathymodiolus sp. 5 South]|uniref:SLATT domain-containing protein n=1 Tax=bacterium endosymbiont of Bathymodiolus sp. 5 South TaxID=1181670 RepID=UPI0010AEFE0C|nr:SLATT domain-containing protein [bacterium endosymbiont of Bathymodiolus sp. 5 South]SSC07127.1 hypothetical protein BTURTLESOX_862 [bacterium endosymbiont of Bathymodiolus sp. 5 South]VVH63447.1 hypothetical protein BSPWISOX_1137 [uncultured Gammaproteobacteria bacterium]VVM18501.1 hypothetical protein BSPWISOXPB_1567 [uncultured Gammaproteobacteria bacterium]VVM22244.1 hypothetical protein BSPWISOXPB_1054 [uncultured Gammaproteobacteria bacterium]